VAAACRCAGCALGPWTDARFRTLLEVGRGYADRGGPPARVAAALRDADAALAEASRAASANTCTIFEGLRSGDARAAERVGRIVTGAVRWALGAGGAFPPAPAGWDWARAALAASRTAPACDPQWRTADVLALARLVQAGRTDALPILADALQDAGCDDEGVLGHCRESCPHTARCWVPDLILDAEESER
jgi:hypothetical protein